MYFLFPETKGLTLEEIGKRFGDNVAVDLSGMTEEERMQLDIRLVKTELESVAA